MKTLSIPLQADEFQTGWTTVHVEGAGYISPRYLVTTNRRIVLTHPIPFSKNAIASFFIFFISAMISLEFRLIFAALVLGSGGALALVWMYRATFNATADVADQHPIGSIAACEQGSGLLASGRMTIVFENGEKWALRDQSRGMRSSILPLMLRNAGLQVAPRKSSSRIRPKF